MKNVFIDSDVILDVLINRRYFYQDSASILSLCAVRQLQGYTTALVFANIYYILRKMHSKKLALKSIRKLQPMLEVIPLSSEHVEQALNSDFTDFEDALQNYSAEDRGVEAIITRNISDYKHSSIPVFTPATFLKLLRKPE